MKILIIGAGITGLSLGKMLQGKCDVKILEKDSTPGGIAKTRTVNGITYHTVGGHCFNSKYDEIMSFVFNILPKEKWHLVDRISKINLGSYEVDYPVEFSIRQIFEKDKDLAFEITRDFLSAVDAGQYDNLEDWFRKKFGDKLCDLYFIPYNTKIWGQTPRTMSYEWVKDKLPVPDKQSFFSSLMKPETDTMPHAKFYYPNTNNQASLINALADGLDISYNTQVGKIRKIGNMWSVNDIYEADVLVSTMPLNILPSHIENIPDKIKDYASQLKYNKVSNVLWRSKPTNKTWTYQPSSESLFHRYIHIGNFFKPAQNYTITESVGEHSFDEMIECGKRDDFLIEPLDFNISDHAYVVFDNNRNEAVNAVLSYLNEIGVISIGRFGQWDYFNMDVCMKQSLDIYLKLQHRL
jgi:protoporphyrinogen oxidase